MTAGLQMVCPTLAPAAWCFEELYLREFFPRWRWPHALLLPAALETALRFAARVLLSQPGLQSDSTSLAEEAARWCRCSLDYLARCAQPQAQQAAGQASRAGGPGALPPAEELLCRLAALASTALKVIAALRCRRGSAAPPLGIDSLEARLSSTVSGCCRLVDAAKNLLDAELQDPARAARWVGEQTLRGRQRERETMCEHVGVHTRDDRSRHASLCVAVEGSGPD